MRPGLTAFGIILLLLGVVFYFLPTPTSQAIMGLNGEETPLPLQIAAGVLLLGVVLFLLGLVLPTSRALPYYIADAPRRKI
jgi:hypothetical protein